MSILPKAVDKAGGVFTNAIKNAMAANDAHAANEELQDLKDAAQGKAHSALYRAVESTGDFIGDIANVVSAGGYRAVGNIFDDKESKVDYKGLKEARKDGDITSDSSVGERAEYLMNDAIKKRVDISDLTKYDKDDADKDEKDEQDDKDTSPDCD